MREEWPTRALGDICKMGSGGTPLTSKREYYEEGTIPWLQSGEVAQDEILAATNFITQAGFENSATKFFRLTLFWSQCTARRQDKLAFLDLQQLLIKQFAAFFRTRNSIRNFSIMLFYQKRKN